MSKTLLLLLLVHWWMLLALCIVVLCLVQFFFLFLTVPWVGLLYVNVVFPDPTHLLFCVWSRFCNIITCVISSLAIVSLCYRQLIALFKL